MLCSLDGELMLSTWPKARHVGENVQPLPGLQPVRTAMSVLLLSAVEG